MTGYTPFRMLQYLNVLVPVWGESSKTQRSALGYDMVPCLRSSQSSGNRVKLSRPSGAFPLRKPTLNKPVMRLKWKRDLVWQKNGERCFIGFLLCQTEEDRWALLWGDKSIGTHGQHVLCFFPPYCSRGIKQHCWTSRDWEDNSHQQCFVMCLVFSAHLFPVTSWLPSVRSRSFFSPQIVRVCAAHCPPSSTCSSGIKRDLRSFYLLPRTSISSVTSLVCAARAERRCNWGYVEFTL